MCTSFEDALSTSLARGLELPLDNTIESVNFEDEEVSFWFDEEQRQKEKRNVLNEAFSDITVASHADILLARHAIFPPQREGRKDCVTSQKNVCVGG